MKKISSLLLFSILPFFALAQMASDSLPFSLTIEEVDSSVADLPGMHSFAYAKSGSKWLFLTGRVEGLHGFSTNNSFEATYANSNMVVIDTATWQVYSFSVDSLDSVYHALLRTTNTEFYQEGNHLFILGGYTWAPGVGFYTAPTIVSIDVDEMMDAIINQSSVTAMQHIRNTTDTVAEVTGGKLMKLGNDYFLVMGHHFEGFYNQQFVIYTQYYMEAIRKFNITDNGVTVSISNFTSISDTQNFHRRDLNAEYYKTPTGQTNIAAYGGVFRKNQDWPFLNPIYFDGTAYTVDTFNQKMSQYTCPVVPLFDSTSKNMYQVFFGGISLYTYLDSAGIQVRDSLVPFIDDVTVQTKKQDGSTTETILDLKMPGLTGSNMVFIPSDRGAQFDHGIYDLRKDTGRTMIGYLFGGIRATHANLGLSSANHKLYRVYLETFYPHDTTADTTGVTELFAEKNISVYPNPANEQISVSGLERNTNYTVQLSDVTGRIISEEKINTNRRGLIATDVRQVNAGIYFLRISNATGESKTVSVIINHE